MTTQDWLAMGMLFCPMIVGMGILLFRLGGVFNNINSMSSEITAIKIRLDEVVAEIKDHSSRISHTEYRVTNLEHNYGNQKGKL